MKKTLITILLCMLCVVMVTGCVASGESGEVKDENEITALELSKKDTVLLKMDKTEEFWVTLTPRSGDTDKITWCSNNLDVANIEKGAKTSGAVWCKITAKGLGQTNVYAKAENGTESEKLAVGVYQIADDKVIGDKYTYRVVIGRAWTEDVLRALFEKLDNSLYDDVTMWCYINESETTTESYTAAMVRRIGKDITVDIK